MSATSPCDVVVIGMGAAGGLLASRLAEAGAEVVGLEAGGRMTARDFAFDDIEQMGHNVLGESKVNHERPTSRNNGGQDAVAMEGNFGLMANAVGGAKLHSSTTSYRLTPWNFRARSAAIERYGVGAIPVGSTLADWPLGYDDLAPYYDAVEALYGVGGAAGVIAGADTGKGNPFEGTRSGPYPNPPLRESGYTRMMGEAARSLGWHPYRAPAAMRTVDSEDGQGCQYCGFCTFNGCWVDAKALPSRELIPRAEATGRLTVRTGARVVEIVTDADGVATGVAYVQDGRRFLQRARRVVLATYVYENTRLLLLSRSKAFPNGLSNNAGMVGRHVMAHTVSLTLGRFPGRTLNLWTGTASQATAVSDFEADNFDHEGLGFIGGSVLMAQMEGRLPFMLALTPPDVARWGAEWKQWLARDLRSTGWAYAQPDPLPYEDSLIDLDPTVRDRHGIPVVRVTYDWHENERAQLGFLNERVNEWFEAAGADRIWQIPAAPAPVSTHAYGGTRMGDDASTSVVDQWGSSHEVPGLTILGASTFPTAGGVNPTETVEALVLRTADRMLEGEL